jgi:DNA polymerase III subunit delta
VQDLSKLKAFTNEQAILASLSTQFTLLMQTAIGSSQNLNDSDIVKLAEIKNPKRLYFLRKELAQISIEQLIWLNQQIKDTQSQLRYHTCDLSARLMLMCCW